MMEDNLDIHELTIGDIDIDKMTALSLVDMPAIETNFILLNKNQKFAISKLDEKNIITGPALIPDKLIYRYDFYNGGYNVFFSKDTVKQISQQFIDIKNNITIDHTYNANNIKMVESWLIEDENNDKANALGFNDLVPGTWMVSYRVDNETILNSIKSGELRGFSIEAFVTQKLIFKDKADELIETIEKIINSDDLDDTEKYTQIDSILEEEKWDNLWK